MSRSLITRSLILAALLIGASGGRAYAMDAGDGVMLLRGDHNRAFTFALTIPASGHDPAGDQPALVFNHHENTYVLSQVWENGTQGREITKG